MCSTQDSISLLPTLPDSWENLLSRSENGSATVMLSSRVLEQTDDSTALICALSSLVHPVWGGFRRHVVGLSKPH